MQLHHRTYVNKYFLMLFLLLCLAWPVACLADNLQKEPLPHFIINKAELQPFMIQMKVYGAAPEARFSLQLPNTVQREFYIFCELQYLAALDTAVAETLPRLDSAQRPLAQEMAFGIMEFLLPPGRQVLGYNGSYTLDFILYQQLERELDTASLQNNAEKFLTSVRQRVHEQRAVNLATLSSNNREVLNTSHSEQSSQAVDDFAAKRMILAGQLNELQKFTANEASALFSSWLFAQICHNINFSLERAEYCARAAYYQSLRNQGLHADRTIADNISKLFAAAYLNSVLTELSREQKLVDVLVELARMQYGEQQALSMEQISQAYQHANALLHGLREDIINSLS